MNVSPMKMFSCRGMLVPALLVLAAVVVADGALLIMSDGLSRMVTLKERGQLCSVHNNKSKIKRMMAKSDSVMVHRISSEELEELMESCTQKASSGQRGFIYPGTKWCGPGNIAKHFDDVGRYGEEDKCCREHDHCPKQLGAGQCRYGICNKSLFTSSHCNCDMKLRQCLRDLNTTTANTVGTIFFNVARVTCFTYNKTCHHTQQRCGGRFHGMPPYFQKGERPTDITHEIGLTLAELVNVFLRESYLSRK